MATTTSSSPAQDAPEREAQAHLPHEKAVTWRSITIGLALTALVDLWIHFAELVMSGRLGHTALANTSIPVGAFSMLFVLTGVNLICRRIMPSTALKPGELLVIYVMMTTSTVLSSSGQLQFIVPTVAAAWHYATAANGWASIFMPYVPHWLAQTDPQTLAGFYGGHTAVPLKSWLPQIAAWSTFLILLACSSLCIVSILRRQWVDKERLSFPTVALPQAFVQDSEVPILRQRLFWLGAAIPFGISLLNTFALNVPGVPLLNLRAGNVDIGTYFTAPPWKAIGYTPVSFYPFVIGIAYLIPSDVTFSCWFFFVISRLERVAGSAMGMDTASVQAGHQQFPYFGYQGAGAFIAIALASVWFARDYLRDALKTALGHKTLDDSEEPMSYRVAFGGLAACLAGMVAFCVVAGMHFLAALAVVLLALTFMVAATRIRAETGDAWLYGPETDANTLLSHTFGTTLLPMHDLTILAYLRPVLANFDLRCIAMPNQLDAFRMAGATGVRQRSVVGAIIAATVFGVIVSFIIALTIWHHYGAESGTDLWRTSQGRVPFDNLVAMVRSPSGSDTRGIIAMVAGALITLALMAMRMQSVSFPLHPVGYALANTDTITSVWLPFFIAWVLKSLALRYGGSRFYRMSTPFILGIIAGDLLGGGFFTAVGAFTGINVYPINW